MTPSPQSYSVEDATLHCAGRAVLRLCASWSLVPDPTNTGVFMRPHLNESSPYVEHRLGTIVGIKRFTSLQRFSPFWVRPAVGRSECDVRPETLWLLAETAHLDYTMIVPLLDATSRYSVRASDGGMALVAETGDAALSVTAGVALFVATGKDPYALAAAGARAIQRFLGTGRLRADKPLPDFVDKFGWCTWDAFYKDVSAHKLRDGLASFAQVGVPPRWLVLDDGWQQWQRGSGGEDRLQSFEANERFEGDLTALVHTAKTQFGIQHFMVWHALLGYWGGLSEQVFADYGVRTVARSFGPGVLEQEPRWNVQPWGAQIGVPSAQGLARFYDDWHARLARQGVDGVKVDAQAMVEAVSAGQGGRIALAKASKVALETSVSRHFNGRLINCMSCGSEGAYLSAASSVMRGSDDFFPDRLNSHGQHLHVNAMVGLWFGEFMQPDWDMFQSAHPQGAFHAAARAVSGGPVYVSDKVGQHDVELLRKLVLWDGTVLRADLPGRPTWDSVFADPTLEPVALKIFNRNRDCGVVGLFNANRAAISIPCSVDASDVQGLPHDVSYVAWMHRRDMLWRCGPAANVTITLDPGEWELASFAPIENNFAALGLADKFNSTAAVVARRWSANVCHLELRDGGLFLGWAARPPHKLECGGAPLAFTHDEFTGRLCARIVAGGPRTLSVHWN